MKDLQGKTALVTGGARRIGREIGLALAGAGVDVAFSYLRSEREARDTLVMLERAGGHPVAEQADLLDLDQCDRLIERVTRSLGPIDILVNNASEFGRSSIDSLESDRAHFDRLFDRMTGVHMRAPLYLSLRLGLEMKRRGWGRIVNITDRAVVKSQSYSNHAVYLASKYGLHGITQCLAHELAPSVSVNSVAPGFVVAPEDYSPARIERLKTRNLMGREAGPVEVANDVLFLIRSEFKTGCALLSDGGESLRLSSEEPG